MRARPLHKEAEEPICAICGNELAFAQLCCPFCSSKQDFSPLAPMPSTRPSTVLHRVVNLERGWPSTARALEHLDSEIRRCVHQRVRILTLIHGYGSSGKGGAIREAVRRHLTFLHYQGTISEVIEGEDFSPRVGAGRQLLRRFPSLKGHNDLTHSNPGITLVVFCGQAKEWP